MDESKFYTEIEQHNDDYKVQSILWWFIIKIFII
jgi:hypothetical protein